MKHVLLLAALFAGRAGILPAGEAASRRPESEASRLHAGRRDASATPAARPRAVRHPARLHVMWIGAHPDDELLLAPLLGRLCAENGADCAFLVLTRGERGPCVLPGGCGDLGALRSAEMQSAAAALHARLTQWTFSDVMSDVDATWSAEAGDRGRLLARIADAVAAEQPDVVYTFDPAHGSTWHAAHREVGQLVLDAVGPARVRFVETAVNGLTFSAANAEAIEIDASADWHYLVETARIHASQFTAADDEALANAPVKKVWWMEAQRANTQFRQMKSAGASSIP